MEVGIRLNEMPSLEYRRFITLLLPLSFIFSSLFFFPQCTYFWRDLILQTLRDNYTSISLPRVSAFVFLLFSFVSPQPWQQHCLMAQVFLRIIFLHAFLYAASCIQFWASAFILFLWRFILFSLYSRLDVNAVFLHRETLQGWRNSGRKHKQRREINYNKVKM